MKTYFISDLHFGHQNILRYDKRPFKTVEEHDEYVINNWNKTVNKDDDVYILGDISWHNYQKTIEIYKSLNGKKHLIIGNHDKKLLRNKMVQNLFVEILDYKELILSDGKYVVLSHYPIPCFNHHFHNGYHLYGHVHNSFEWDLMKSIRKTMEDAYEKPCEMYNVGIMLPYMDYRPKTLEELLKSYKESEGVKNEQK